MHVSGEGTRCEVCLLHSVGVSNLEATKNSRRCVVGENSRLAFFARKTLLRLLQWRIKIF